MEIHLLLSFERGGEEMLVKFSGRRLREERRGQKRSQDWLAEQADTSIRYIRDLEKGVKSNPSAELLYRLSNALDLEMEDLMTVRKGEENKT